MTTEKDEFEKIKNLCELSSKYHLLDRERERELLHQAQCDNPALASKATELLVLHNLRLVIKKAREFSGRGIPMEDLCQEGITGIIRAIEKFDLSRESRFSTYEFLWIEQRIRRCIENKSRLVKIPLNVLAKMTQLKKIYKRLQEDFNRPPTTEEIAALLNISEDEASALGRFDWQAISLDDPGEDDTSLSMISYLVDEHPPLDEELEIKEDKAYCHALLGMVSTEDAAFLKLKWGIMDNKPRTAKEMGMLLKVPAKEIEARELKLLSYLKNFADKEEVNFE